MKMEKTLRIPLPAQKVWDQILDLSSVLRLMPGVEKVEAVDAKTYKSVVKSKMAGISVSFDLVTTVTEATFPVLKTVTDGKALGGLGRVSQNQALTLKPISDNEVECVYEADITLAGRLATFGDRIFRAKATEMADRFIEAFLKKVSPSGGVV